MGQRADLLLLQGNPLEDVRDVSKRAGVMVNEEFITEEMIQARLKEIGHVLRELNAGLPV